jgi:hypothetical protein
MVGYTGTIHFTSANGADILPADYTFTADDAGSHLFSVTFTRAGVEALAANDSSSGSIAGSASVQVVPGGYFNPYFGYGYSPYAYSPYGYSPPTYLYYP